VLRAVLAGRPGIRLPGRRTTSGSRFRPIEAIAGLGSNPAENLTVGADHIDAELLGVTVGVRALHRQCRWLFTSERNGAGTGERGRREAKLID
jgi:hypothetical protein